MNEQEYNKLIPHVCTRRTLKQHMEMMPGIERCLGRIDQYLTGREHHGKMERQSK